MCTFHANIVIQLHFQFVLVKLKCTVHCLPTEHHNVSIHHRSRATFFIKVNGLKNFRYT